MNKILLLLVACFLFACTNKKEIHSLNDAYNVYQELTDEELTRLELGGQWIKPEVITFDIKATLKNPPPFSIVDTAVLIPLETTDDCLIGKIKKIISNNELFYIWDRGYESIYVFTNEGRFKTKIGVKGRGPGEYREITDFAVSGEGDVYLLDYVQRKILIYDVHGKFKRPIHLKNNYINIRYKEGRLILTMHINGENNKKAYRIEILDTAGKNNRYYFPSEIQKEGSQLGFTNMGIQANKEPYFLYFPQLSHHVYAINDEGKLEKNYFFHLMDLTTPPWLTLGARNVEVGVEGINRIRREYSFMSDVYDLEDYLMVEIRCGSILHILHSKKNHTNEIICMYDNLPSRKWPSSAFTGAKIAGVKEGNTLIGYSTVSALKLRNGLESLDTFDFGPYNSLVSSLEEDANPVIMLTKIKMTDE